MTNYDTDQWLIFNYVNGSGGKFLINCFFQFDKVANWYSTNLTKQQRADAYNKLLLSIDDVWVKREPDQPWGLNFYSRTYPRGEQCNINTWNHQVDSLSTDYFKQCWNQQQIIPDFWHRGTRPTFWSKAKWITIRVDDFDLYKSLLFTKVYDYNKNNKTVICQMENPNLGSESNQKYKKQFKNPWYWENINDIDQFMQTEIAKTPWYSSWQNYPSYDNENTINLSDLFDIDKLWAFIVKYETVFDDQIDFEIIKTMQQNWVKTTEKKSKHVF